MRSPGQRPESAAEQAARDLTPAVVRLSEHHGFDRCAIAPVESLPAALRLEQWLRNGLHGSMEWMARTPGRRSDPRELVTGAQSVIIVALNYHTGEAAALSPTAGRISRYAWGDEYHRVFGDRLAALFDDVSTLLPGTRGRWYVDTGPVMEKAWAERAGIGWVGKHTNLITRDLGSWIFLGAIVIDARLRAGNAHRDYCGTCTACIEACPTDAIVAPYVLDARRCISYLTIENRGPIPLEFRPLIGNHIFGCDDCQDVCPWNRFARSSSLKREFGARPQNRSPELAGLLSLSSEQFSERFKDSPVRRAKRRGFVRNVAVALGNSRDPSAVPALVAALDDTDALVRGHVAWALGQLGGAAAGQGLAERLGVEDDADVIAEIRRAIDGLEP